jgi:hypothetical protein
MRCGPDDRVGGDFRLEDRRDGLGMTIEGRLDPMEVRGVDGRKLHHAHTHAASFVSELAAQRFGEPLDRVLRAAVGRLERYGPVRERGPDLHDHPGISGQHPAERGHRAVDVTEVRDLGDPPVVRRGDIREGSEDRNHRIVDPHVDGTEFAFDPIGGRVDGAGIRNVCGDHESCAAARPDVSGGGVQGLSAPGK